LINGVTSGRPQATQVTRNLSRSLEEFKLLRSQHHVPL
jgi:hypothetical protein